MRERKDRRAIVRQYRDGSYGEVHSLSCAWCEEEDWGYKLITGRDLEKVSQPPADSLVGICPDCFEQMPEDWHNADDIADAAALSRLEERP
jgi:hypothetical protein